LEERVGKSFFDELPTVPGVYMMYGRNGQLHYVGKAKNLRRRLFSYRRVTNENSSRKIRRLVRMTYVIEINTCKTEEAALLKENALIRTCKPKFNRAKKSPETYYFLTFQPVDNYIIFRLSMRQPDEQVFPFSYGSFKGHRTVRKGTGALLRQLYLLEHDVSTVFEFPTVLTNNLTPLAYKLPICRGLVTNKSFRQKLASFLEGRTIDFLETLIEQVRKRRLLEEYLGRLILKDCESMKYFFDRCLNRNFDLKQKLGLPEGLIPQEKLDDYLVQCAYKKG